MNPKNTIEKIKEALEEADSQGLSDEELFGVLTQIIPPKVIYEKKQPKSSPERLEYLKEYRLMQKELGKLKEIETKKELYRNRKIKKSLERTGFYCYKCKSPIKCNQDNNSYSIEKKKTEKKDKIIVKNTCLSCGAEVRAFGGYL